MSDPLERGADGHPGAGASRAPAADVEVVAAAAEHAAGLTALFEEDGSPCYCRFWHFAGDNNAWLERCANARDQNRDALVAALHSGSDEARGVVALAGAERRVVGWLKVAPVAIMGKVYTRRLYRGLPCFDGPRDGVFVVGCALVAPGWRHRGVTTAMVGGAVRLAPGWGARALEAFPRRPREPVADGEMWTGPASAFTAHGFIEVNAFDPYPVLRREL
jgi:GNAT superfamily N-acetyltransferase